MDLRRLLATLLRLAGVGADRAGGAAIVRVAVGSTKWQFALELEPTLYTDRGRWRCTALLTLAVVPDTYYAPGPDSPASSKEHFAGTLLRAGPTLERQLLPDFYLG